MINLLWEFILCHTCWFIYAQTFSQMSDLWNCFLLPTGKKIHACISLSTRTSCVQSCHQHPDKLTNQILASCHSSHTCISVHDLSNVQKSSQFFQLMRFLEATFITIDRLPNSYLLKIASKNRKLSLEHESFSACSPASFAHLLFLRISVYVCD